MSRSARSLLVLFSLASAAAECTNQAQEDGRQINLLTGGDGSTQPKPELVLLEVVPSMNWDGPAGACSDTTFTPGASSVTLKVPDALTGCTSADSITHSQDCVYRYKVQIPGNLAGSYRAVRMQLKQSYRLSAFESSDGKDKLIESAQVELVGGTDATPPNFFLSPAERVGTISKVATVTRVDQEVAVTLPAEDVQGRYLALRFRYDCAKGSIAADQRGYWTVSDLKLTGVTQ